jgi:hypothetical protein
MGARLGPQTRRQPARRQTLRWRQAHLRQLRRDRPHPAAFRQGVKLHSMGQWAPFFVLDIVLHEEEVGSDAKSDLRKTMKAEKTEFFLAVALLGLALMNCPAEDIVTLDGHKYENVTDLKEMPDGIMFSAKSGTSIGVVKVPFSNLSDDLKKKYHYDQFEEALFLARKNSPVNLSRDLAFPLAALKAAKAKAAAEGKAIGFILVWDQLFKPGRPMEKGPLGALAHFYAVFNQNLVLVFVDHNEKANKLPRAVRNSFLGEQGGAFAPKIMVVSDDCTQLICEIPYSGDDAAGQDREETFRAKHAEIKKFLEDWEAAKSSAP